MRTFNIWTKLIASPTRSNGGIYTLGPENSKGRVREGITCCMRTLIIDHKTPIIYDLNMFFIFEKWVIFILLPKNSFFYQITT